MKKACVIILGLTLILTQCSEKQSSPTDEIQAAQDRLGLQVEMPQPRWDKSLALIPQSEETPTSGTLFEESVIQRLGASGRVKVVKPVTDDIKADYILAADSVVMQYRLSDQASGRILWEGDIEENVESVLVAVEQAASTLQMEEAPPHAQPTHPETMDRYLRARTLLQQATRESVNDAIGVLKGMLRDDPSYTPGYVTLAGAYVLIARQWETRPPVWLRLGREAARAALDLNPRSAEAHFLLGEILFLRGDMKGAEARYRQAVDCNPNLTDAWAGLGRVLYRFGLYRHSLQAYDTVLDLNPGDAETALSRAMILIGLGQYQEAGPALNRLIQIHPERADVHAYLALTLYYRDEFDSAITELNHGLASDNVRPFTHAVFAMIDAKRGDFNAALQRLEVEIKPYVGGNASMATAVATVYALIGRNGLAVKWLEEAAARGYQEYLWLANDPNFGGLKNDERFNRLMADLKSAWESNMRQYAWTAQ